MNIFENLENLNVSEECFNDIMDIVEEIIDEKMTSPANREEAAKNSIEGRRKAFHAAGDKYGDAIEQDEKDQKIPNMDKNYREVKNGNVYHVYGYDEDDCKKRDYVLASPKVQDAYKKKIAARNRLEHAKSVAGDNSIG